MGRGAALRCGALLGRTRAGRPALPLAGLPARPPPHAHTSHPSTRPPRASCAQGLPACHGLLRRPDGGPAHQPVCPGPPLRQPLLLLGACPLFVCVVCMCVCMCVLRGGWAAAGPRMRGSGSGGGACACTTTGLASSRSYLSYPTTHPPPTLAPAPGRVQHLPGRPVWRHSACGAQYLPQRPLLHLVCCWGVGRAGMWGHRGALLRDAPGRAQRSTAEALVACSSLSRPSLQVCAGQRHPRRLKLLHVRHACGC